MPKITTASSSADLTFSSFDQLKTHATKSYDELTLLEYTGTSPLVIQENLQLPDYLCLDLGNAQLTIPADVEFSVSSWDHTSSLFAGTVHVKGVLTSDYLEVTDALTVEGSVKNNNVVYLNSTTKVIGAEKITSAQAWSTISCWHDISDMPDLKKAISDVSSSDWQHYLNISQGDFLIDETLAIPAGCELYIDCAESTAAITIAEGCILELNCSTWVYTPVVIEGILNNRNCMNVFYSDGGRLFLYEDGFYLGEGSIFAYSNKNTTLSAIMYGFDLADFEVSTFSATPFCRQIKNVCQHSPDSLVATVTAPSCTSIGYTTNSCSKCGGSYKDAYIPALGHDTCEWNVIKDATCTATGTQTRSCQRSGCDYSETETIPAKGHEYTFVVTDPTCIEEGYTTHTCSCGESYVDNYVAPNGKHTYSNSSDESCNICGAQRVITSDSIALYRVYNPYTHEHLLSSSESERDSLVNIGWQLDGVAWKAPSTGTYVYRLYNPYDDWHTYSISQSEIDAITALGWKVDGVMSRSADATNGTPIYRLFNPYEQKNYHLFTASKDEMEFLTGLGWVLEGVAWYGILN